MLGSVFSLCLLIGCSSRPRKSPVAAPETKAPAVAVYKIETDAYLFDAVLNREGTIRSFRLELFTTDSLVALAGRGYLGKGALRGLMKRDSILVYFPTTNEFVDDAYSDLLADSTCGLHMGSFDPIALLHSLPDTAGIDPQLDVQRLEKSDDLIEYRILSTCGWRFSVTYDLRQERWCPREIGFENDQGTRLTAIRREFRPGAFVKADRFLYPIPVGAIRLPR